MPPINFAAQCTARTKGTGERCLNPALVGLTVCRKHGGAAPAHRRKSAVAKAERKMERFVRPIPLDDPNANPATALHNELLMTLGRLAWLRKQISKLQEEHLTWGVTKVEQVNASETPGVNTTWEQAMHPYLVLEERERKHLLAVEKQLASNGFRAAELQLRASMVNAAHDALTADFLQIAALLGRRDPDDPRVLRAMRRWAEQHQEQRQAIEAKQT